MATRRSFTQEYRDQVVSLHVDSGRSIAEVAVSIGVHEATLGKCAKKVKGNDRAQDKDLSETERTELERLRKENSILRIERDFAKTSGDLVREGTAVKYAAIADWAPDKEYSVTCMCDQLGVIRQGHYRWRSNGPCQPERTDAEFTKTIREMHSELHGHPGVRRVFAELVVRGVRVAAKRVWRLMQAYVDATHEPGRKRPSQVSARSAPRT